MAKTLVDLEVQSKAIGDGKLLIGAATTGLATAQTISGDITISNAGAAAIASGAIIETDLSSGLELSLIRTDGSAAFGANQPMGGFKLTGLAAGSATGDSARYDELILKAPIESPTFTGTVSGITATMVGLGNVTNESKATMFTSPTFTGTVSGVTAAMVSALALSGGTMSGAIAMGSNQITGLSDGTLASDAINKGQLDAAVAGLDWKASVLVATTANITLSGEQTIDGVLTSASRVLVKDQTAGEGNGIYVSAAGAWTRATDADSALEVTGAAVFVEQGTANANRGYTQTADSVTLNTTALTWVVFTAVGGDASTLDGIDSTSFLRSDATDSFTSGTLSVASGATLSISSGGIFTLASGSTWNIGATAVTATAAHLNDLGTIVVRETPSGTPNGVLLTFGLAQTPKTNSEEVYVNGILMDSGLDNDYQMSGANVVFEAGVAPLTGAKIRVSYRY